MKKLIIISVLFLSFNSFCQEKRSVVMTEHLKTLIYNGQTYEIRQSKHRPNYYVQDSITWVYANIPGDFRRMIKIGFYNDFKSYIILEKFEKRLNRINKSNVYTEDENKAIVGIK